MEIGKFTPTHAATYELSVPTQAITYELYTISKPLIGCLKKLEPFTRTVEAFRFIYLTFLIRGDNIFSMFVL